MCGTDRLTVNQEWEFEVNLMLKGRSPISVPSRADLIVYTGDLASCSVLPPIPVIIKSTVGTSTAVKSPSMDPQSSQGTLQHSTLEKSNGAIHPLAVTCLL